MKKMERMRRNFIGVGTVGNVYNWLSYGVVGKSVCRMWKSCPLACPCSVNGLFHDVIASYAYFHGANRENLKKSRLHKGNNTIYTKINH